MTGLNDDRLHSLFERWAKGIQTDADVVALQQAIKSGEIILATGGRAVAVGGNVTDAMLVTGDGNVINIFKGSEAEALEQAIDRIRLDPLTQTSFPQQQKNTALGPKAYRELVGRDTLVGNLKAALRDPSGKWVVAIDGMGGIGKTALAREIVDRCLSERLFSAVVWEQSPKVESCSTGNTGSFTFQTALDAIARQLGAFDVSRLNAGEKEQRIKALLHEQRVLIVLDNLETSKDPQDKIADSLHALLHPSKALLTSRIRFKGDVHAIHLTGLDEDSAIRFIHQEADGKSIIRVDAAESSELKRMAKDTGGSPLALKLVVGQAGHLPLGTVLSQLREVRAPEQESDEDDYYRFYKAIFFPSWDLLTKEGKGVLISTTHFAAGIGGTFEAMKATSDLAENVLTRRIDELWRLSFLEVGDSLSLKTIRYYLHPLTRYFVLSDIVKILK